jgi:TonB family protein
MLTEIAFLLAAASPAPSAAPSATPVPCNRDVTIQTPVTPDYPDALRRANVGEVRVAIDVTVNANGKVASERILESSGLDAADQAALAAASQSTYLPKMVDCKPVAGHYLFKVTFDPR